MAIDEEYKRGELQQQLKSEKAIEEMTLEEIQQYVKDATPGSLRGQMDRLAARTEQIKLEKAMVPAEELASWKKESEASQKVFERLLTEFKSNPTRAVLHELDTIEDINRGEIQQAFFVEPNGNGTDITSVALGVQMTTPSGKAEYRGYFFKPIGDDKPVVGELNISMIGQGRGMSGNPLFGGTATAIADRYDAAILQAAVNSYNTPIRQSTEVGIDDTKRRALLTQRGYHQRDGYPQVYERTYTPQEER